MALALLQLSGKHSKKKKLFIFYSDLSIHSLKASHTSKTQTSVCAEPHGKGCSSRAIDRIEDSTGSSEQSRLKERMDILHGQGIGSNPCGYASLLEDCIRMKAVADGKLVHAYLIESGCKPDNFLETKIVIMYAKCGVMSDARRIFDEMSEQNVISSTAMITGYAQNGEIGEAHTVFQNMPERDVITWNAMIAAYAQNGFFKEALEVFRQMQETGMHPSSVTFSSVLSSCANLVALEQGKEVHGYIIRSGIPCNAFMGNALVDMYAKCGYVKDARQVFDKMPERNVVSWNAIVGGYALNRHSDEALELFQEMPERNLVSWNVIIVGFVQSGCVDYALKLFCEMPEQNIVSWNAMLAGFVQNGCSDDALILFRQMRQRGVNADSVTVASVLPACADLASLQHGKEVHEDVVRYGAQFNICVRNALVDMYAKCGSIEDARKVFDETPLRNVISWTAMIVGYAMHGYGKEALQIFKQMLHSDSKPNSVTFIGVLSACCHAGLVDDGWKYFHNMSKDYQITPSLKHYSCMVDLLGRAGHLTEAEDFINKMAIRPDVDVWASLLGACRIHNNIEIGERVAGNLFELDPKTSAHYVQLSNIYAEAGMWDDVENVRKIMKARGIKKTPGCSWIEVNNKVFAFLTGDKSFSEMKEICANMDTISGLWADGGRLCA